MKRLLQLIYAYLLVMTATVMPACSGDEPAAASQPAAPSQSEAVQSEAVLQFEVQLPSFATRTPEGDYDPGSAEWENHIDVYNDMRIYFFTEEDTFIAAMDQADVLVSPVNVEGASDYKRYKVTCSTAIELPGNVKILVLANYGKDNYPTQSDADLRLGDSTVNTLEELYKGLIYHIGQPYVTLSEDQRIPMFGILKCIGLKVAKGELANVGTINMLRAMAKIEVTTHPEEVSTLKSVELLGYNTNGYLAPLGVFHQDRYVTGAWETDYTAAASIPTVPGAVSDKRCVFGKDGDKYVIYVPEYKNTDTAGTPLANRSVIKLKFADHDSREYTLEFKDYESGKHFDIMRNYYYRYVVRRNTEELDVEAEVYPYTVVNLKPEFGIETGTPVWEGMWFVSSTPLAFDEMSARYFDWSTVKPGQHMRIYLMNRAPEGETNACYVAVRKYTGEGSINGLPIAYTNPDSGFIDIELTKSVLDEIKANEGISLVCRYLILYRITIK